MTLEELNIEVKYPNVESIRISFGVHIGEMWRVIYHHDEPNKYSWNGVIPSARMECGILYI